MHCSTGQQLFGNTRLHTIKANPLRGGDAKPRVFTRFVEDSLAAEGDRRRRTFQAAKLKSFRRNHMSLGCNLWIHLPSSSFSQNFNQQIGSLGHLDKWSEPESKQSTSSGRFSHEF